MSAACAIEDVDSPAVIGDKIAQALSGIGLEGGRLSSDLGYLLGAQPAAPGAPGPSLAKRLLAALAELIAGAAILLVVTSRGGARRRWASTAHALELTLPPLSAEDARGVIRGLIEAPLRTHDLERCILEQAEGNPLFLEELSRAAIERGQGAWAGAIPATIEKTVTARLDRLAPELRRLLAIGAAIGREVPLPLLCAVAEIDAQGLAAAGGRLQRGDFVYESGLHLGAIERLYPDRLSEQVGQLAYHALLADQRVRAVGYLRSSPRARCAPAA